MADGEISTRLVVDDAGLSGAHHHTVLSLSWSDADPLAVNLDVSPRPDHPSLPRGRWVVLRDFLRYGCSEPTGDGEVRICPSRDHQVLLRLRDDDRMLEVHVPVSVVLAFLDETEAVVPTGHEAGELVMDELIRRLLDRA